jgi:hypothetical protein
MTQRRHLASYVLQRLHLFSIQSLCVDQALKQRAARAACKICRSEYAGAVGEQVSS